MLNGYEQKHVRVAIVGGGLVGSLNACYFAKKGYEVDVYEHRPDLRTSEYVRGRSINLALSLRGLTALSIVGLRDLVLEHGIPMYARMIHDPDGKRRPIPYGIGKQCIYSVGRRYLNEIILNAAEKYPNVTCHFKKKLVHADLRKGNMTFISEDGTESSANTDLIVGCDGAFSAVRRHMLKEPHFNFSQKYIEHGYLELCMPPDKNGDFAMEKNYLHIWPRGNFMMIALPNQDHTYTVTLFMPFEKFEGLNTANKVLDFFKKTFPDAVPLIGESLLLNDFFAIKPSTLVTVKCSPYHIGNNAVIMGDAAHAMVPFYGQGMNCGFEDCLLFDQLMTEYNCDTEKVLKQYSKMRNPDAEAICDLALYNYIEMRHLVNTKAFIIRKRIDQILYWCFPKTWIPLYTTVTFTRTPYKKCIENKEWQDKILSHVTKGILATLLATGCTAGIFYGRRYAFIKL